MAGIALADGATWTGSDDGRTWEVSGTGLVRDVYEPEFRVSTAATTSTASTWGSYVDKTAYLQAFSVRRQVADWYLGPRPATGTFTFEDVDGDDVGGIGEKIKLEVKVPSGWHFVFMGLITDQTRVLSADKYPQIRCTVTDWLGYESQATETLTTGPVTNTTWVIVGSMLALSSDGALDTTLSDTGGVTQTWANGTYNLNDMYSTLIRGDLGLLFVSRKGEWVYRAGSVWWSPIPAEDAIAAIGSNAGTPPDDYTYRFPHSKITPVASVRKVLNDLEWTTPHATAASQTAVSTSSQGHYGIRRHADTVWISTDVAASLYLDILRDHVRFMYTQDGTSSYDGFDGQVMFPADLSTDSMEYAAHAEISDFVNVALESLEGYWQEWEGAHVLGVQHQWSPTTGWYVTLDVTTRLYSDAE